LRLRQSSLKLHPSLHTASLAGGWSPRSVTC